MADPTLQIVQTFGGLGILIVVAGTAIKYVHAQLTTSLEKRVSDAQAFAQKLLELVEAQHAQIDTLTKAIDGTTDANREMRITIEQALRSAPPRAGGMS